ncbi:hypothetical protein FUA23_02280 [Neolewinella aurantiaca]|uniref:Uncharacterized protein n=1 Tax=Neolewinella aurantiaca TaxID=2602767 RepID=A0A5C7FJT7_9BACT|nr:hypothetical protein [Neolewinella aurantiaca]TXF91546.1 hypothetical protein FUA23_02280 [Neolewinella aurantiaca]
MPPANHDRFFGDYSFSETVGLWLEKGTKEASCLLNPFISTEGFAFTPDEYLDLLERLRGAVRRYNRLPGVSNGLEDLNTGFFRYRNLEESTAFIRSHLTEYLERGDKLHRNFLLVINQHARSVATEKRRELREKTNELEKLERELTQAEEMTGRRQRKVFAEIAVRWENYLKAAHRKTEEETVNADGESLRANLENEREALNAAFTLMGRELKTDGLSLSALTVNPRHGDPNRLRELEGALNDLLREVDEAGLYQLPLRVTDAATTPRQLQQLDSLLGKLRNTELHLGELPVFYDQRHFWYAQPAHLRRLLAPLLDLPPEDWETAFSSWYFERCLEREQRPERFFLESIEPGPVTVSASESVQVKAGNLGFVRPGEAWPSATSEDLLLDLSGKDDFNGEIIAKTLSVNPLSDVSALPVAVSGHRDPVLLFSQSFQPLHPPAWRERVAGSSPAGPPNCVLFQSDDSSPWCPLSDWDGSTVDKLNVFLPEKLTDEAGKCLIDTWESLIASAPEITFFHTLSPNTITQGLLSDGINGAFLTSVLLRAAEAAEAEPFDRGALAALGREVRIRCGLPEPGPHPLAVQFGNALKAELPDHFIEIYVPWRDTFLPLVLQSPSGRKSVLLPDGRLPGRADKEVEMVRQEELRSVGFDVLGLNALNCWENLADEVERIVRKVKG